MSTVARTDPPQQMADATAEPDALLVSVVIPCLNEAENIERCVSAALASLERMRASALAAGTGAAGVGEVVVVDNDSEDDSAALAARAGARVVHEKRRGYGSAYLAGFAAASGRS
ncbi:MAG: glycosyltransferase, partial [Acidobacteriota bacterium]|nr:glycosyltransferase [Acidobacteriota bacterium]